MVNFTIKQLRDTMSNPRHVRNISVIAHVDHGKTTLTDSLIARAGIISSADAGSKCYTDGMNQEKERGITIVSTGVSLFYSVPQTISNSAEEQNMLVNLIDSPGHIDFSAEVTAALRVTDGAIVVVDCVEGPRVQTETVLRQALQERIKPVLVINKIDRLIFGLGKTSEDIYTTFQHALDKVNAIVDTVAHHPSMGSVDLNPSNGTVTFASAKMGFGFTLTKFARILAPKLRLSEDALLKNLWGNHYYNPSQKTFTTKATDAQGKPLQRLFCFVMDKFLAVTAAVMKGDQAEYDRLAKLLDCPAMKIDGFENGDAAVEAMLKKWMPVSDALLEMTYHHLPSPCEAQRYRVDNLYTGPMDDANAKAIRECDANGPLVMFVSKMVPTTMDGSRFYAFGRVFSGTVSVGQQVRIMTTKDSKTAILGQTYAWIGKKYEQIDGCPCGSTVAIAGIEQYIPKSATIVTDSNAFPIVPMQFSVAPVVRVAVRPKNVQERDQLITGLQKLSKFDQLIQYSTSETDEIVVSGVGELHIEVCMRQLAEQFAKIEIVTSDPVVSFRETVTVQSSNCLAKSQNRLNRLQCNCGPLDDQLVAAIERGELTLSTDPKTRAKKLTEEFGWEQTDARKVWALSQDYDGNVLVDTSKGLETLHEVREYINEAFQNITTEGPLCGEPVVGVRFNVADAVLHKDASHRNAGQILPAARRSFSAAMLSASPALFEPIYHVEVTIPQELSGAVYTTLAQHRGVITDQQMNEGSTTIVIHSSLPVAESFGLDKELRMNTSGRAFSTLSFSHWQRVEGDAYTPGNRLYDIVRSIRKRKHLPEDAPTADKFIDRL